MRVKISYTIDIEDVEKKVSEIMTSAGDDIEYAVQSAARIQLDLSTKTGTIDDKIQELDKIRLKLASADQVLSDCSSILEGLKQAKKQIKEQENEVQDG